VTWYYSDKGRQVGPIEESALDDLYRSGVVRNETPVWREGMANWQPYASVRPVQPIAHPLPPAPAAPPYSSTGGTYVQPVAVVPGFAGPFPGQYAVWANRVIGYLIDSIFVFVVMGVLYAIGFAVLGSTMSLGNMFDSNGLQGLGGLGCCCMLALFPAATLGVGLFNRVHLVSQRGSSIGQGMMKIKIVDARGQLLTFGTAFIRLLAQAGLSFIPLLGILDLAWPLWDPQRQTLHDKAVGSYAINMPQSL
jgi:uncharacterized RDD family membrane protein YckC